MTPQQPVNITGLSAFISGLGRTLADLDCMTGSATSAWILQQLEDRNHSLLETQDLNDEELHTFQLLYFMVDLNIAIWKESNNRRSTM